jgi:hypothetical protein
MRRRLFLASAVSAIGLSQTEVARAAELRAGRVIGPLRPRAAQGFEDFFFSQARDVYPRYDFARMADDEYGAALALG